MTSPRVPHSSTGTAPELSRPDSHSNALRRHRHPSSSRRELQKRLDSLRKQRLALAVAAATFLALSLAVGSLVQRAREAAVQVEATLNEEREASQARLAHLQAELSDTQKSLSLEQERLAQLVAERIPGLRELVLDQTMEVGEHHVRDITFTRLRSPEKTVYEYKVVIENRSPLAVTPAVKILLFDRLGVQLGRSQLVAAEPKGEAPTLRPGEIRSFFAMVELDLERDPFYFLLTPASKAPVPEKPGS